MSITFVPQSNTIFGSDPELFAIDNNGEVVASSDVVPMYTEYGDVKQDGFQMELNPGTSTCRQSAAGYLRRAIREAYNLCESKGLTLSFDVGHTISSKVWSETKTKVKRFGCNPTESVYEKRFKRVTGLREKFRAGGGHIHLGNTFISSANADKLVTMMDIVVGNTFVLLDRDTNNIVRRKNYGRAGEYRLKSYGLEYRVLSNVWVKKYVLWSTATGMLRNCISLARHYPNLATELIGRFDLKKVRAAINNNDKDLAMENFLIYRDFLKEKELDFGTGLSYYNVDKMLFWVSKEDPLKILNIDNNAKIMRAWCLDGKNYWGMEDFLDRL